jgi:hypothetical protein
MISGKDISLRDVKGCRLAPAEVQYKAFRQFHLIGDPREVVLIFCREYEVRAGVVEVVTVAMFPGFPLMDEKLQAVWWDRLL